MTATNIINQFNAEESQGPKIHLYNPDYYFSKNNKNPSKGNNTKGSSDEHTADTTYTERMLEEEISIPHSVSNINMNTNTNMNMNMNLNLMSGNDYNNNEVLQRCKSQLELQKLKIFNTNHNPNVNSNFTLVTSPDARELQSSTKKKNSAVSIGSMKSSQLLLVKQNSMQCMSNEPISSLSKKNRAMDPNEMSIKLYARNMLEKILLDNTFFSHNEEGTNNSPLMNDDYSYLLDGINSESIKSLKMILLVFYNQYYVVANEQIEMFNNIDNIDFQKLFSYSKKMKVTIFRKIQKVKTLFKRFLSDRNLPEKVTELESLS